MTNIQRLRIAALCAALATMTACCPSRYLATSTRDSITVETVVRTERIPDTVFVEVPVERELTWWQQTKMKGFWVLLAVLAFVFRKNILGLIRRFI